MRLCELREKEVINLGTDSEYVIPYHCVKRIGPDIILVEIREEKFLKKL